MRTRNKTKSLLVYTWQSSRRTEVKEVPDRFPSCSGGNSCGGSIVLRMLQQGDGCVCGWILTVHPDNTAARHELQMKNRGLRLHQNQPQSLTSGSAFAKHFKRKLDLHRETFHSDLQTSWELEASSDAGKTSCMIQNKSCGFYHCNGFGSQIEDTTIFYNLWVAGCRYLDISRGLCLIE